MADFKEHADEGLRHVQVIDGMTQTFISAVQNFRDIQSREPINRKVMEKYLESVHAVD